MQDKSDSYVPYTNELNTVHNPRHFIMYINITLSSTIKCAKWSISLRFPGQHFVCIFISARVLYVLFISVF